MTEDNFSIEHIEDWEYSETPIELFFDLDNISFSHKLCNSKARDKSNNGNNNRIKTHCPLGHIYDDNNTIFSKQSGNRKGFHRECKKCKAEKARINRSNMSL